MPRTARSVEVGVPYHITQRGNFGMNVFDNDIDKEVYLSIFESNRKKHKVKLYAWCLMDNHVHFILEPQTHLGLRELFKATNMTYSKYFNRKRGTKGKRWQERYYSVELDNEHLYEAIRYVELNPVRAFIVANPFLYKYSSAPDRIIENKTINLDCQKKYFEIEDWVAYLKEPISEELVNNFKYNSKTGRPLIKRS